MVCFWNITANQDENRKFSSTSVDDDDSPLKSFIRINAADLKSDPCLVFDISDACEKEANLELGSTAKNTANPCSAFDITDTCEKEANWELGSSPKNTEVIYRREDKKEENVDLSSPPNKSKKENSVKIMALSSEAQASIENDEIFKKILSGKNKFPSVSILDFAGQSAYYACHQIYVTPKAFFILALDMTKRFEDVVENEKDNQEGSIFSVWTYKDYLKFWITAIKTFGGKKAPVFLVVTHTETKSKDVSMRIE
ncbi:uncharacterized protein LOC134277890 [Saccostrea cucullata]|uniref:uncharacterized protein LOC134277890 n=1 Tax=Saccostrea cuccullata TaxID=36930 RepID=UPI002ED4A810